MMIIWDHKKQSQHRGRDPYAEHHEGAEKGKEEDKEEEK